MEDGSYTVLINGDPQQYGSLYSCNQYPTIVFGVVAKLDAEGNLLDNRCYGGYTQNDSFADFIVLEDGYLYVGCAASDDGDLGGAGYHLGYNQGLPHHGRSHDAWLLKTDFDGNVVWSKCYGGALNDAACKVFQNDDGGFTITGWSESRDGDVQSALQLYENPDGSWGAPNDKEFVFLCQDALYPPPYPYGDINCPNVVVGSQDNYWVFHLTDIYDYDGIEEQEGWNENGVGVYPNPSKDLVRIYGVEAEEVWLYNALGQVVKTVRNSNDVSLEGLPQGVYMVRIRDGEGRIFMEKVMVR